MANLCIALVAGEVSGDILGAGLMRALKAHYPVVRFIGVGGLLMQAEGLMSYFPMERLSVLGLLEVLSRLRELRARRKLLIQTLIREKPDVFVGIDAPDFTLNIELKLRQAGIKTVHYVSPSVWAWRQNRVLKIRDCCDLMLILLPFEARFYEEKGVRVRFVGHTLADTIPLHVNGAAARAELGLPSGPLVALLPGSRGSEIKRLVSIFFDAAKCLQSMKPNVRFVLPCASPLCRAQIEMLLEGCNLPLTLLDSKSHLALAACDAALITSGTATLEALLYKRPMVVVYRLAPLTFWILKRMVKSPYISLPNLLAQRLLVPELLQDDATPEALAQTLLPLIDNGEEQIGSFKDIHHTLRRDASNQAADAVLTLIGQK
ncbi:lipid-A-disaccharide synthase [Candidatus Pseudomonas adelgestsugas]|uniref:Lipid-A-disaccharide synthase n=1 Tax=Candidatus Pseudomonas adelgestsugas TaxID=1302376 RepID=A0ABX5R8V4_9PSED|nr:lipid-A-disaccharide synthase [Candidatus Pseudomonas adelgestsugas]QAX82077.1 Lipid-A-disaccharide synthase [Candidatus Pseudomonas adelgestsugas]